MSFERIFVKGRTVRQQFTLVDKDGTDVGIALTDRVRFKIGRGHGNTPDLDLVDGSVTSGSGVDIVQRAAPATIAVIIGQAATLEAGAYDAELLVVDDSVASPTEDPTVYAESGVVHIVEAMGGTVGKPS